jgi:phosphatidylserine/phosphatidylglycerophosphate/cardiolipin synthase-like enzyme
MVKHLNHNSPRDMFTFYTHIEYRTELLKQIRQAKAGDRLLLMSMTFEPTEPDIAAIMRATEEAAARGVDVIVAIDANSFLMSDAYLPGPLWGRRQMPKNLSPVYRHKLSILEAINAHPTGHADIINLPKNIFDLPVSGRSHIKAAIINNQIFLGGCNLQASTWVDVMIGWKDTRFSDRLFTILKDIIHSKHAGRGLAWTDRRLKIAERTELLIDAGKKRQSLIFDEALRLIDSAEEWLVITCQFFPNSVTASHLKQALKRGVKVEVVYAHPRHHGLIGGLGQHVSILREKARLPRALFSHALDRSDPMLHAKLLACDKGVMIGSHNYVSAGVILGTAEIALKCKDENIAREAVKALHRGIGKHI